MWRERHEERVFTCRVHQVRSETAGSRKIIEDLQVGESAACFWGARPFEFGGGNQVVGVSKATFEDL